MKKFTVPCLAAITFLLPAAISAQEPAPAPKPGPQHEKLAYYVGAWKSEGEIQPTAFGPGGKFTFTETCDWLPGKFAIFCKDEGNMMGGAFHSTSILSYDLSQNSYIYFQTNNWGENDYSHGSVEGDTWTWKSETIMNGQPIRTRYIFKGVSPDAATFTFEMAMGSQPFANVMTGKQTRQK